MSHAARTALVLQGGGALGAYELGAARALYENGDFAPDIIAGVSIGAITAALLARPARGRTPLQALEAFWEKITMPGSFLPAALQASFFGNPNFFVPRHDYFSLPSWTYLYDTSPLRQTLSELVDLTALADRDALPGLLVSATNVEEGQIEPFYSGDKETSLSLDHIVASGSLPPSFPMTSIGGKSYWDGGVFDNTPLGAVLDKLDKKVGVDRTIYVVNLFPNKGPIPTSLIEVVQRVQNLQFANKTAEDLKLLHRFDQVAALMNVLKTWPGGNPLEGNKVYEKVESENYIVVPRIVSITNPSHIGALDGSDFSAETIRRRAEEGYNQTKKALRECDNVTSPCSSPSS
jgi:predicted acylesterase/phospholipase RssA